MRETAHKHRESAHALHPSADTTERDTAPASPASERFQRPALPRHAPLPRPMPDRERQGGAYHRRDTPDHRKTALQGNPSHRAASYLYKRAFPSGRNPHRAKARAPFPQREVTRAAGSRPPDSPSKKRNRTTHHGDEEGPQKIAPSHPKTASLPA